MALHPDVQKKAQAELDAVVGSDRLPDFTDQGSLLYLNALTKEVLRWHAVAPIGVPHRSVDDDFYKDSLIPGGSIVMANQWSVHAPAPRAHGINHPLAQGFISRRILISRSGTLFS